MGLMKETKILNQQLDIINIERDLNNNPIKEFLNGKLRKLMYYDSDDKIIKERGNKKLKMI